MNVEAKFQREGIFKELQYYHEINQKYQQAIHYLRPRVNNLITNSDKQTRKDNKIF